MTKQGLPDMRGSTQPTLLGELPRYIYRIPFIGRQFRRIVEARLGNRPYQDQQYWNKSLSTWASAYLGGTLSINLRNAITLHLVQELAPHATSLLDLGCAGGSLALCLGPEFRKYCGVDISDVAIEKARENLRESREDFANLAVADVQNFQPSQKFDVIVFNEVLYYLSLEQVSVAIRHHSCFLADGGLILVSLKEDEVSSLVQGVIMSELQFQYSVVYQQQAESPRWKTARNRQTPAYLVQAFRKR